MQLNGSTDRSPSSAIQQACHFPVLNTQWHKRRPQHDKIQSVDIQVPPPPNLAKFCEANQVTCFQILQLAWAVVLASYTGSENILFGCGLTASSGAGNSNQHVIDQSTCQLDLARDCPIMKALRNIKATPAGPVQRDDHLEDPSGSPKLSSEHLDFNTLLALKSSTGAACPQPTDVSCNSGCPCMYKYPIVIIVDIQSSAANAALSCWASILSDSQAKSVAATFGRVIAEILQKPLANLGDLNLCSAYDMRTVLDWNQQVPERVDACVHDRIYQQSTQNPHKMAVCSWDGDLTYSELERLSSHLASHLAAMGVGPEILVPLYFEKSKWTIVSILGVIKAGGAYALLDPSYPITRMHNICEDLRAQVMLASSANLSVARNLVSRVVEVSENSTFLTQPSEELDSPAIGPQNALYVVFTSGSTGRPKGVVIEHGAFCTRAMSMGTALGLQSSTRVLQFASHAFDAVNRDVLFTLMFGACICVPSETDRFNNLEAFVTCSRVNWASLTPSVAELVDPAKVPGLQTLVLVGEPMTLTCLDTWADKVNLMNAYGPSETVTLSSLRPNLSATSDPLNIGRGVGSVMWIVDAQDHEKLVPVGAVGELVIEGVSIGRGYINDHEKTERSFLRDAHWLRQLRSRDPGRIYKTGDLARYDSDGTIHFIGRKDSQVKINGQRVELGDVEHNVRKCLPDLPDSIQDVVVDLVSLANSDGVRLAAILGFGLRAGTGQMDEDSLLMSIDRAPVYLKELEMRLKDSLPGYMVPSIVIPVRYIPLNRSGKTDRLRLRKMVLTMSSEHVALCVGTTDALQIPETEAEFGLRALWAPILHVEEDIIGQKDHFFRRGGDSIAAMRLVGVARDVGLQLTLAEIFAHPTLSAMAQVMKSETRKSPHVSAPFALLSDQRNQVEVIEAAMKQCALSSDQIEDIYPCTPMQEGLIALSAKRAGAYISLRIYELPSDIDMEAFEAAWKATFEANPPLRTRIIQSLNEGTLQVVVRGQFDWLRHHDLDAFIHQDSERPMEIGSPLIRLAIIRSGSGVAKSYCVIRIHHAISDAWSMPQILEQVDVAYHGHLLSPRSFSPFVDYVLKSSADAMNHWQSEFSDLNAIVFPPLPSSTYVPHATLSENLQIPLPPNQQHDFTISTRLRLAWAMTLSKFTASEDVVFGVTVTGRSVPVAGIDRMPGNTVATFPLHIKLRSTATIQSELHSIQERFVSVIPFEQFGLQHISRLGEKANRACQFQNILIVQPKQQWGQPSSLMRRIGGNHTLTDTYVLAVYCILSDDSVDVRAVFDGNVITQTFIKQILLKFADYLKKINENPTAGVESVQADTEPDVVIQKQVLALPVPDSTAYSQAKTNGFYVNKVEKSLLSTAQEKALIRIVRKVLALGELQIGMDDSFFRLGGNSISAMRLVGMAREAGLGFTVAEVFEYPRLSNLAQVIKSAAGKIPSQDIIPFSLLKQGLDREEFTQNVAIQCGITLGQIEDIYPCTALQEGFMASTAKRPGMYVARYVFQIPKEVIISRFRNAWESTVQANPILRTRIILGTDKSLYQVVVRSGIDWVYNEPVREKELGQYSFLSIGLGRPLAQFALVSSSSSDDGSHFILTLHHALYDRLSWDLLFHQAEAAYHGEALQLRPFSPFIDHTLRMEGAADFWRSQLSDSDASTFPPLPSANYEPVPNARLQHLVPPNSSPRSDFTASTLFRLAWAVVIGHYTDSEEVVFGGTVAGRSATLPGVEQMTGPTIATVPLRLRVRGEQTVWEALSTVQNQSAAMIPFEQSGLQWIRKLSPGCAVACEFQSHLVVQPSTKALNPCFLRLVDRGSERQISYAFSIVCHLGERPDDAISISVSYDAMVIETVAAEWLLRRFVHVYHQLQKDHDQRVANVQVICSDELQLLKQWNTSMPVAAEECLHKLVIDQCVTRPTAIAVTAWDGDVTYGELNHLSEKLTGRLVGLGVGPNVLVLLCMDRSWWVIVAMMAVLRAGGACVPIDPTYPRNRIQDMIKQSRPKVILASLSHMQLVGGGSAVVLSLPLVMDHQCESTFPASVVQHSLPAFILFTSGSTGKPKAVVLEHRNLSSSFHHHRDALGTGRETRALHFASYAFDASIQEIFLSLISGGCLCIPSEFDRMNNLSRFIRDRGVNWACLTPSTFRKLIRLEDVPCLKTIVLGGEVAGQEQIDTWASKVNLIIGYGPAEASICSVASQIPKKGWQAGTIGRAVGGRCWITLPSDMSRLAAIGAVGELIIEGPIVARGYLNDHEKTSAAFFKCLPFLDHIVPSDSRHRLYRTGDLVQYVENGLIRYIGRKDTQVKLRGQRIEMGEVEHNVQRCFHDMREVVAEIVTFQDKKNPVLVAFIHVNEINKPMTEEILGTPTQTFRAEILVAESRLQKLLPRYMIPALFVPVSAMPMTKTGKIDRHRLQEQVTSLSVQAIEKYAMVEESKRMPSTDSEAAMQHIWAKVLDRQPETIGTEDNFFRLGGDSIAAMQLVGIGREAGVSLTVADVFAHPVLSDTARIACENLTRKSCAVTKFPLLESMYDGRVVTAAHQCDLNVRSIEDIYPCTMMQESLLALSMKHPGAFVARWAYDLPENVNISKFHSAWEAVFNANPILRTRIVQLDNAGLTQVVVREGTNWSPSEHLAAFHLEFGRPLIRVAIEQDETGTNRYRFSLLLHHVLYDGWSVQLLLKQLQAAYMNRRPRLQKFRPFVDYLYAIDSRETDSFWASELADLHAATFPSLPSAAYTPNPRKVIQSRLPIKPNKSLGVTLSTVIRLAWSFLMSLHTGSTEVVFGVLVNGRSAPVAHIEDIIGPTIATVPLRVRLEPSKTNRTALHDLQRQSTQMIPFEQAGLGRIKRLGADATAACNFQTLLVIETRAEHVMADLFCKTEKVKSQEAVFDTNGLTLICDQDLDSVNVKAVFDEDLIPETQMRRILSQFGNILEQLNAGSNICLADMVTISPGDLLELKAWNPEPDQETRCVHELIRQKSLSQPKESAVCAWDGDLTYEQLDQFSSELAARLQHHGVGRNTFVPLLFEKSRWTVVAILAVVKAGGAFALLEPAHPMRRLQAVCDNLNPGLILCSSKYASRAADLVTEVIALDANELQCDCARLVASAVRPEDALYTVFTSGSTGRPKGVVVEHGAFCSSMMAYISTVNPPSNMRALQFASYAFDVCISDMMMTLIMGGCVCIPSDSDCKNNLIGAVRILQANWADFTPSLLRTLSPQDVPTLRTIVVGGESLSKADLLKWGEKVRMINAYGPAECCVLSTVQVNVSKSSDPSNIGFATGCVCWIVDPADHDRLTPIGAVGELLIEGPTLGREYLNDPEKSKNAFINSPAWLQQFRPTLHKSSRLYKTGDLVQYAEDGSLRFVGRKDTQVKLHGQRVELTDVEFHVRETLPLAKDVVVDIVNLRERDNQAILIAFIAVEEVSETLSPCEKMRSDSIFVIPHEDLQSEIQRAEANLLKRLPSYMIPNLFLPLRRLPLMTTGKTDRSQLRQQASALSREELDVLTMASQEKRPPTTQEEKLLVDCCSQAMRIHPLSISIDDSFFRLGGDSITAMKVVALLHRQKWQLNVADIFASPRMLDLALRMRSCQQKHRSVAPFSLLDATKRESLVHEATMQCAIADSQVEDIYPCTPMQEGLMAMTTKDPAAYVCQMEYELQDDIELNRFEAAWNATVETNPILRTRIFQSGSQTLQVVVRERLRWEICDNLQSYLARDRQHPMAIGSPLARLAVVNRQSTSEPYIFILTIHHSLYDGFSLSSIFDQVEESYRGRFLMLRPFNAFIAHILESHKNGSRDFWKSQFAGLNAAIFPGLPSATYIPASRMELKHIMHLPRKERSDFTMSTAIQLTWAALVAHYTDTDDVVFGVTLTGRNTPMAGIENMTGPTLTTVPMRIQFPREATIRESLHSIQEQTTAMIPFEQTGLQNIRRINNETTAACSFQNHLGIQPAQEESSDRSFFKGTSRGIDDHTAFSSYPLVLVCSLPSNNRRIDVSCNIDTRIVSGDQAERMLWQFETVLIQLMENPDRLSRDLQIVSRQDISQLAQWNALVPQPYNQCVHDLILENCHTHPESVAVSSWDGQVSYAELDAISSKVAYYLTNIGSMAPGSIVPLCFEKSKWAIISMMAVLRAGGACLLVDPSHPRGRIEEIISQTESKTALICYSQTDLMKGIVPNVIIVSSSLIDKLLPAPKYFWTKIRPDSAAFVVFTSGSTGKPKGIVLDHTNLSTSIHYHGQASNINRHSRSLHFASYAFDASIYETCTTLALGGCICVISEADRMNDLPGFIRRENVNWATLTNSSTTVLRPDDVPSLQSLLLGGEAVTQNVVDTWAPKVNLFNGYGPAEATICAVGRIEKNNWKAGTIGFMVGAVGWIVMPSNTENLAAIGAVGELLIEGPVLARGYLNDPVKTAASFIENPPWLKHFRQEGQGRLYKTGDLVQYNMDGSIRYIGRKDTQVKLRGQRVELGEVECRIRMCLPRVQDVAVEVIVPAEGNASAMLAAFIYQDDNGHHASDLEDPSTSLFATPSEQLQSDVFAAQAQLSSTVPSYMVPGVFITLSRFPKTKSGKIDRRLLRERASLLRQGEINQFTTGKVQKRPPSTAAERDIQQLCASTLNRAIEEIGADDNFFNIGGDSILAMRMVTAARKMGIRLTVAEIFCHPKLSDLARSHPESRDQTNGIVENITDNYFGLSSLQELVERLTHLGLPYKDHDIENALPATEGQKTRLRRPCFYLTLDFDGYIDHHRLEEACTALIQRHSILRTVFVPYDVAIAQIVLYQLLSPISQVKIDDDLGSAVDLLCQNDNPATPIFGDPITHFTIVNGGCERSALIVRLSHAQFDGLSTSILWDDLANLYQGLCIPEPNQFSAHIYRWLAARNEEAFSYWKRCLEGSHMTYLEGASLGATAPSEPISRVDIVQQIPLEQASSGITTATLVKAAWSLVISRLTDQTDVVFGQTTNNRTVDTDNVVGLCINSIPVRIEQQPTWTVLDLLLHMQSQHRDSIAFESLELCDIIQNSTNWPKGTKFGSSITHQNIALERPFAFNGTTPCTLRNWTEDPLPTRVGIQSTPRAGSMLEIHLVTSNSILSEGNAQKIVECLCSTITTFTRCPNLRLDEIQSQF